MTTQTLRARRLQDSQASLALLTLQREECIRRLIKVDGKLKELRRRVARYEKPAPVRPTIEAPAVADATAGPDMPDFLDRRKSGEERDRIAREAIEAEQAEKKKNRTRVRIETMKAKKAGLTKQWPLEGKAALAAIRQA